MKKPCDKESGPARLIVHDIRNALSCIKGYADMLRGKLDHPDEEAVTILSSIRMCSDRVDAMVKNLMYVVDGSDNSGERESTDMVELVLGMAENLKVKAAMKRVSIDVEVAPRLPKPSLNRVLVERAVANLIDNSIKYTQQGGHISIRVDWLKAAGEAAIVVSVADDGPGIPAGEQEMVFDRFYRCSQYAHIKGYGLGLAVVKAAAEAHGGLVELKSESGKGSEFRLVLPIEPPT